MLFPVEQTIVSRQLGQAENGYVRISALLKSACRNFQTFLTLPSNDLYI